jgi:hypothetical protein
MDTKKFPVKDLLNSKQMERLNRAILKTFQKINVDIDLPENIPTEEKYDLLIYCWDDPVSYLSGPGVHLDFCSGDCEGCRINKYCKSSQV